LDALLSRENLDDEPRFYLASNFEITTIVLDSDYYDEFDFKLSSDEKSYELKPWC